MKRIQTIALIFGLTLFSTHPAWSASRSWELDKGHSALAFQIDHIFSTTFGQFHDFDAVIIFDPTDLANSSISVKIKVDSIDTNISKRDKHLLSPDFFNAAKFPQLAFASTSISKGDGDTYNVKGTLQVKGKEYDLTLPLQYLGPKPHPMKKGSQVAGFNINISLDRLVYGIGDGKFYKNGVVGKDVLVQLSIEALSK
jgi:polyisoprenoid-binding protein YceI